MAAAVLVAEQLQAPDQRRHSQPHLTEVFAQGLIHSKELESTLWQRHCFTGMAEPT